MVPLRSENRKREPGLGLIVHFVAIISRAELEQFPCTSMLRGYTSSRKCMKNASHSALHISAMQLHVKTQLYLDR